MKLGTFARQAPHKGPLATCTGSSATRMHRAGKAARRQGSPDRKRHTDERLETLDDSIYFMPINAALDGILVARALSRDTAFHAALTLWWQHLGHR